LTKTTNPKKLIQHCTLHCCPVCIYLFI